jgi:hypothetical protein
VVTAVHLTVRRIARTKLPFTVRALGCACVNLLAPLSLQNQHLPRYDGMSTEMEGSEGLL